jgi:hypothetical protein
LAALIFTYLLLKLAFAGVAQETNRLALEQEIREKERLLKSRLIKLQTERDSGSISDETFLARERQLLQSLNALLKSARRDGIIIGE